jgi:hypothetical protein
MRPMVFALAASSFLVSSVLAAPREARAEGPPQLDAGAYASAEYRAGFAHLGVGAGSIGGGVYSLSTGSAFGRGLAVPLLAGGLLHGGIGAYTLRGAECVDPASTCHHAGEVSRVGALSSRLGVAQALEATAFAAGGLTAYFGSGNDTARGFGLGLAFEAATLLAGDVFASYRADRYAAWLRGAHVGFAPVPSGGVATFSLALH